jgi:hypothetical protein
MAQGTQQIREDSPRFNTRFTIDCVLPLASTQLQADGCVLENLEDGHKLITPDYLRAGDLVKVQLWLEGEEASVDIPLAVVSKVRGGPSWLDSMFHFLSGASQWSDYAAVSRVVRLSQYTCSGVLPSSARCGLVWL